MPYMSVMGQQNQILPSQIPSLNLWYDASESNAAYIQNSSGTAPANGQAVKKVIDKMGFGRDVDQATGSRQALWIASQQNGLGALQFDGINDIYTLNPIPWALSLPGATVYIVTKPSVLSGTPRVTAANTGGFSFYWNSFWGVQAGGGVALSNNSGVVGSYIYMGQIFNGALSDADITTQNNLRLQLRINGGGQALTFSTNVGTATNASANSLNVGSDGTNFYTGYIGEMLIWTRALSLLECLQVENYLSNKWNIK